MKRRSFVLITLFLSLFMTSANIFAQEGRNVSEYNLQGALGMKGYDPVSYWPEGGSEAMAGDSSITLNYEGVTYRFTSTENRELFLNEPEKYESTYGGWCAWGMANGSKIEINPEIYTIAGKRIHFFIARRAKRNFDRDIPKYEQKADVNWKRFSGEEARN